MQVTSRWTMLLLLLIWCGAAGAPPGQTAERGKAATDEGAAGGDAENENSPERRPAGPPPDGFGPGHGERQPGVPPRGMGENLASLKKSDPELFKLIKKENDLDRRIKAVAKKYRAASKDQQTKVKEDVRRLAAEQFEVGQKRRALELKYREKTKQQVIEQRVSQAIGQADNGRRGRHATGHGDEDGMGPMGPPPGGRPPE